MDLQWPRLLNKHTHQDVVHDVGFGLNWPQRTLETTDGEHEIRRVSQLGALLRRGDHGGAVRSCIAGGIQHVSHAPSVDTMKAMPLGPSVMSTKNSC